MKQAAELQGLNVTSECGDVATVVKLIVERGERFDALVVNPPRRGMSPMAREWAARLEPAAIAYVSCDPDTLARDLDHFLRLGYTTGELRPLDMIPLTDEVETVAILRRTMIPTPQVLFEDDDIIVVEKGAHEPTSPQSEYAGSLLSRARKNPPRGGRRPRPPDRRRDERHRHSRAPRGGGRPLAGGARERHRRGRSTSRRRAA